MTFPSLACAANLDLSLSGKCDIDRAESPLVVRDNASRNTGVCHNLAGTWPDLPQIVQNKSLGPTLEKLARISSDLFNGLVPGRNMRGIGISIGCKASLKQGWLG